MLYAYNKPIFHQVEKKEVLKMSNEQYRKDEIDQILSLLEQEMRLAVNREERSQIREAIAFFKREKNFA